LVETGDTPRERAEGEEEPRKMQLEVKIDRPSACERHLTVTISREDIDHYIDDAFSELMPTAAVPGFRAGRAPRKLVENRFRKDVTDRIKGTLLMDSMAQVSEDENLTAISEPDLDLDAVVVPDEGPMTFEFDLEVRPEFDLPQWKGLEVERPTREFTDEDVNRRLEQILARYGKLVPREEAAEDGDYLTVNLTTHLGERKLAEVKERLVHIRPTLSFHDGNLEGFGDLMKGVKAGETREGKLTLTQDAANEELRGQEIGVTLEVLDVKRLELPELTPDFLQEMGQFETEGDLRDAIKKDLERQLEYRQQQRFRNQITALLTESADWDLPPGLLRRQSVRELERSVLELRRNGFSEAEIRAHENELRQNSAASTAKALKEHFILERIAEEENIDAEPADYDQEIMLIALQSGESPRRVRAQLEKQGMMDALRNQIVERKTIDKVLEEAEFKDVPFDQEGVEAEAIDVAAGGEELEVNEPISPTEGEEA
jgi:trigger factor